MLINKEQNPIILPLTIDGIFKMYFEDPSNLPELRCFLKAYLELSDEDLSSIQVLNPGLLKDNITDKSFTVDLLLKTKSGEAIHIEMQASPHKNFKERFQLYNARKAGQQIKVGENYSKVRRTISLVITTFQVFNDSEKSHEKIIMRRENGKIFTNVQELNIIDLTKTETDKTVEQEKYLWGKLFQVTTLEELKMIAKTSEEMAEATDKLLKISADEHAQAYALSRENAEFAKRLHEQGLRDEAIEEGTRQGTRQGESNKAIEIAKKMLCRGDSIEDITELTDLSIQKVKELDLQRLE